MKSFLPPALSNPTRLEDYLLSTFMGEWDYLGSLNLSSRHMNQIPFETLLENPMDVAQGVTKVETKFGTLFFNIFDKLVIKHFNDGSVTLMFHTEIKNPNKPLNFYQSLKAELGGGYHYAPKFSTFEMTDKVIALAKGKFDNEHDELLHFWNTGNFGFTLNFKLEPFRQLLFSVSRNMNKEIDRSVRAKGTLLQLLKNDINKILEGPAFRTEPYTEQGRVTFTDYYYKLNDPEFGIFEQAEIKLNGEMHILGPKTHSVVTYYSKYEINTDKVLKLVDDLVGIYGTDDYGYRELHLHEIELIEARESWTGRSWMVNQHHALQDLNKPDEHTAYQVSLTLTNIGNPDDKGLHLYVIGYNTLLEYDALMKGE